VERSSGARRVSLSPLFAQLKLELSWIHSCSASEEPAEVEGVIESGLPGSLFDAAAGLGQELFRMLEPLVQQVAVDGGSNMAPEDGVEMSGGVVNHLG